MAFIRLSLMTPQTGQEQRIQELLDELLVFYRGRPGFITAYRLDPDPHATTKRFGRISIWESEDAAHSTASEERDQAVQSQLRILVLDATREEYSFMGVQVE